jgi:hypothetical protein
MRRAYAKRQDSHKPEPAQAAVPIVASGREIQLSLDRDELLGLMKDSLQNLALKLKMLVASTLLEDEVARLFRGPTDADEGAGGVHPSTTTWYRARRRVRMAGESPT